MDKYTAEYFNSLPVKPKEEEKVIPHNRGAAPVATSGNDYGNTSGSSVALGDDPQRKRELEIKNSSSYKSIELLLKDCIVRKKLSQVDADNFLKQFMVNMCA